MISKILFQTSKRPPSEKIVEKLKQYIGPDWDYLHFTDQDVINFFIEHPIDGFEAIQDKFHSFKNGAHKADLFRYYFLYLNGGVFIDSDALLNCDIESIVNKYSFFSVNSSVHPKTIFQGFIGASPGHPIVFRALMDAYNINLNSLDDNYHLMCKNLYDIIEYSDQRNTMLYIEAFKDDRTYSVLDHLGNEILFHYWKTKIIDI